MTTREIQSETESLSEQLRRYLALVRAVGVTTELEAELQRFRDELQAEHRDILREQKKTLRASLPPPDRGRVMQVLSLRRSFVQFAIPQIDDVLSQERAA